MSSPRLDWSTAEVSDAALKVSVQGEITAAWRETFERTAALLRGGDWDTIRLKKRGIHVSGVTPGNEEKLRHHLEGLVQEANEAMSPDDDERTSGDDPGRDHASSDESPSADSEMTERFRSFAHAPPHTSV